MNTLRELLSDAVTATRTGKLWWRSASDIYPDHFISDEVGGVRLLVKEMEIEVMDAKTLTSIRKSIVLPVNVMSLRDAIEFQRSTEGRISIAAGAMKELISNE